MDTVGAGWRKQVKQAGKIVNFLNRDSGFENEPKRVFVILRCLYLFKALYFVVFCFMIAFGSTHYFPILGTIQLFAALLAFAGTYFFHTKGNLIFYGIFEIGWIISFVYIYGWDCGVQHFIFALMVLIYFSMYDALLIKMAVTAGLFLLRFCLFLYCRMHEPLEILPESFIVLIQIYNSFFLFVQLGIVCSIFSSNIKSAEKKLIEYNRQLEKQASTDPLTGMRNRRSMLEYMQAYQKQNPGESFVIAMGDIDFFKRINDQWGHDCGDAVLVWMAELFRKIVGDRVEICRWGGEEFIFHFSKMNGDEAKKIVSELWFELGRKFFLWHGEEIRITMTFGIEENDFQSDLQTMIKRVDEKLYIGKREGRNRIIF